MLVISLVILAFIGREPRQAPSSICPPADLIFPCTCSKGCGACEAEILCRNIFNSGQLSEVFRKSEDYTFWNLAIENSSFPYIASDAIVQKRVRKLYLRNNVMVTLFDKPPPPSNRLSELELTEVVLLGGMKWKIFSSLLNLKNLNLTSFELRKIDRSFMDNFPQGLTGLYLTNTKTKEISDNAFSKLTELSRVFVKRTQIKRIKRSMFAAEAKLIAMHFTENQISILPDDIFSNMPNLAGVGFSHTNITTIKESVFGRVMPQLKVLLMEGNEIYCNCQMKWITRLAELPFYLKVVCSKPSTLAGKSIKDLTSADFLHCEE